MSIQSFKLMLMVLLAVVILMQPAQAAVQWRTLVSLTFDDGLISQSDARAILAKHHMNATFYVNSDRIDDANYLSKPELDSLIADGNEIGGHTINHVDLATLSDSAQRTAICDDVQNLVNWFGVDQVHSLAYPFSSIGPSTQSILASGCSGLTTYESARAVGGLVSGSSCASCPWAVNLPPGNRFYIPTNSSVKSTTTLADLQNYVLQAENHGGGWVPVVMHRVCDGCDTLSISPALFDQFLTWLEPRAAANGTYVRTVHQVMSGDYPPALPLQLGPNLLKNPSLELDADNNNQADCWYRSNYGTNTATWTHRNDATKAHSGYFSETVNISSYNSGDRKLLPTLDSGQAAGGCAPNVVAGQIYELSAWYKATAPVSLVLFYLDANNAWQYWRDGNLYPAVDNWTQFKYYATELPSGAKAISFGLALNKVGELSTDDYSLAVVTDSGLVADATPPLVSNPSPVNGSTVTGVVSLSAVASDDVAVDRVEFLINGTVVGTDTTSPYAVSWNSAAVANGVVSYSVRAIDSSNNLAVSGVNNLTVINDAASPTVAFIQPPTPQSGDTVSGQVTLSANASDDIGVSKVEFLVNSVVIGTVDASPYTVTWNTALNANGATTLSAKAYDTSGNITTTPIVNLTINNTQIDTVLTNPSLEIDANNDSVPDCWRQDATGSTNNRVVWTRINNPSLAHSGSYAQSVQLSRYKSGDVKLLQDKSSSACVPSVVADQKYTISAWYKSTVATSMVVFYRDSSGNWVYWLNSSNFSTSKTWKQASYTLPAVPVGATAISFGLAIQKVGTLVTDDYAIAAVP